MKLKNLFSKGVNSGAGMKKFYKQSTFEINKSPNHPLHKYLIKLDDKNMRTPYQHMLAVPSSTLALLVTSQFNRQQKHLKTGQMPFLSLCRTAVDADIQGNIAEHLKHTIYEYLKTDTLNFFDDQFEEEHQQVAMPLIKHFNKDFKMNIKPSDSLIPPQVSISPQFIQWVQQLNNWQLIGMQTMTVWFKSTISAYYMTTIADLQKAKKAATLEEVTQMKQNGQVQEKIMDINQLKLMVSCGQILFNHGKIDKDYSL